MLLSGTSSKELSLKTQIERSTLIKILNGSTTNPRIETIYSLAEYFKVDIKELLFTGDTKLLASEHESEEIKDRLTRLMELNGITSISLLTKYTGIATSILSEILSGNTKMPQMATLQQLAKFFNISVPQLTGVDKLTSQKTISITPAIRVLPVIQLEQVSNWISGNIKNTDKYFNASRSIIGNRAHAISIEDNRFIPDFISNHILVVDNEEKITVGDFLICKLNEHISIYECATLNDTYLTLREAGTLKYLEFERQKIKCFGVVIQQVLNRKP